MPATQSGAGSAPANTEPHLDNLRAEIDALDDVLLDLIERRLALAGKVAARKGQDSLIKLCPRREAGIVARLTARARLATPTLITGLARNDGA